MVHPEANMEAIIKKGMVGLPKSGTPSPNIPICSIESPGPRVKANPWNRQTFYIKNKHLS